MTLNEENISRHNLTTPHPNPRGLLDSLRPYSALIVSGTSVDEKNHFSLLKSEAKKEGGI